VDSLATVFLSEVIGTAMLILLGGGVVANVVLAKNKGFGGGFAEVFDLRGFNLNATLDIDPEFHPFCDYRPGLRLTSGQHATNRSCVKNIHYL